MDAFVYGTLTDRDRVAALLDRFSFGPDAVLRGLRRVEGEYPTLAPPDPVPDGTPAPGELPAVRGRILATPEADALDAYEGVDRGLYVRVSVPRADGEAAETYVGDPDRLGVVAEWPGEGDLERRVRRYVREHEVRVE